MILRFVNKQEQIVERFLAIQHVYDTFTFSLTITLDELFANHGLPISKLRGQRYDETSNMRQEFNILKVLILNENSFAFYIHWWLFLELLGKGFTSGPNLYTIQL